MYILKSIKNIFLTLFFIGLLFGGFMYEPAIQKVIPWFSFSIILSGIILILGSIYAILMRNILIIIISLILGLILPYFQNYFFTYWGFFTDNFFLFNF